jgi:hypothetical protein
MENKEIINAVIETVVKDKVDDVVKKVDDTADVVLEKVEEQVEKVVEKLPEPISKVVEIIDSSLVGYAVSCGCLGWKFSAEKLSHKKTK